MEVYVRRAGAEVRAAGPAAVTCDGVQFAVNQVVDDIGEAARPLIATLQQGRSVCVVAYGETGTGKTSTLMSLLNEVAKALLGGRQAAGFSLLEVVGETS